MNITAVLQHFADMIKNEIRVSIPAEVESFDPQKLTVNVRPLIKAMTIGTSRKVKLETGEVVTVNDESMPSIVDVPVSMIWFGNGGITFPIKKGCHGTLLVSDRDIRLYKNSQQESAVGSLRRFNLSDAIFQPFLPKRSELEDYNNEAIQVRYDSTLMNIDGDGVKIIGEVEITGNTKITGELEVTMDAKIGGIEFKSHTHTYSPGALPPSQTQPPTP